MNEKPLSIREVIDYAEKDYGEVYHYNTVLGWLIKGRLKGFKRGGQWRVYRKAVDAFFCPENQDQPFTVGANPA